MLVAKVVGIIIIIIVVVGRGIVGWDGEEQY